MLQAWIVSPRGSLYFAATPTPYNLQTLRTHVRALAREGEGQVRLALTLGVEDEEGACPGGHRASRRARRRGHRRQLLDRGGSESGSRRHDTAARDTRARNVYTPLTSARRQLEMGD